ncbi:MAG TPA: hypothetical protein VHP37_05165 [Burkholderiales bacterium]|nr:hypothetical protein [Burkholderiales bacterium]
MITRQDIDALRTPLIAFLVTIVAAVAIIFVSGAVLDSARADLTKRENDLRQARLKISNAGEEKELISKYLGAYQQLARAGFVGEEQRITWLDSLRAANEEARIFGVDYDLSAQRPYVYASEFNAGQLLLQESVMHLRFGMLHEEDLPRFLEALARRGGGYFTVDDCVVRRLKNLDEVNLTQVEAKLSAECNLRWLTVRPPGPGDKKG